MLVRTTTVIRTNWRLLLCSLAIVMGISLFSAASTSAVTSSAADNSSSYSITMTPSATPLQAPPGGSVDGSFTAINEGNTGYKAALSVAPYRVLGDNYQPQFTLLPGKTDASAWIHLHGSTTENIAAKMSQTTNYTLTVPAGTAPGGYYAVIFAETEPPAHAGVTAHNRVGDIIYITVEGPVLKQGSLGGGHLPHLVFGTSLPISLLVKNTGGLHFLTSVNFSAKPAIGQHLAFQANLQRYVLPQTERLVTTTWSSLPIFGVYQISRSATVFGGTQSLPMQQVIIIRPWLLILIILVVIASVGLLSRKLLAKGGKKK